MNKFPFLIRRPGRVLLSATYASAPRIQRPNPTCTQPTDIGKRYLSIHPTLPNQYLRIHPRLAFTFGARTTPCFTSVLSSPSCHICHLFHLLHLFHLFLFSFACTLFIHSESFSNIQELPYLTSLSYPLLPLDLCPSAQMNLRSRILLPPTKNPLPLAYRLNSLSTRLSTSGLRRKTSDLPP